MDTITLGQAKKHLEELIARAARGEDVRIADPKGREVRLAPVRSPDLTEKRITDTMEPFVPLAQDRVPGRYKGKLQVRARLMEPVSAEEQRDW